MRWTSRSREPLAPAAVRVSSSRRSSVRARWEPRLECATAWISSTITASTPLSIERACEVRIRYSDSGVVTRMSGGLRAIAARSRWGVSPVRIPTRHVLGADAAQRCAQVALDVVGEGLQRADVDDAGTRTASPRSWTAQPVERPQERGERLARAGGCGEQHVLAPGDRGPGLRPGRAWVQRRPARTTCGLAG